MMNWIKKQGVAGLLLAVAAICAIVAVIIYGVNSTTGVMQNVELDAAPIVYSVIAIVLVVAMIAVTGKVPQWVISAAMVVSRAPYPEHRRLHLQQNGCCGQPVVHTRP